jgi:hypothetical protein
VTFETSVRVNWLKFHLFQESISHESCSPIEPHKPHKPTHALAFIMGPFGKKELPKRACRPENLVDTYVLDTVKRRRTLGSGDDCKQDSGARSRNQPWVASATRLYLREKLSQPRQSRVSTCLVGAHSNLITARNPSPYNLLSISLVDFSCADWYGLLRCNPGTPFAAKNSRQTHGRTYGTCQRWRDAMGTVRPMYGPALCPNTDYRPLHPTFALFSLWPAVRRVMPSDCFCGVSRVCSMLCSMLRGECVNTHARARAHCTPAHNHAHSHRHEGGHTCATVRL